MKKKKTNFLKLARIAAQCAYNKKATAIMLFNTRRFSPIADYVLLATTTSSPQSRAVIDAIKEGIDTYGGPSPLHTEGKYAANWAVLDYGGILIHIMSPQVRQIYALEKMWPQARKITLKMT